VTRRQFVVRPRAQAQIRAARAWWRRNRDKAPSVFDDDLDDAFAKILDHHSMEPKGEIVAAVITAAFSSNESATTSTTA
jgi:hypothetical protein